MTDFTGAERAFCALTYDQTRSVAIAQRKFSAKFEKKSPTKKRIKKWHSNFVETGNITKSRKAPAPTVATLATASTFETHFNNNQHDSTSSISGIRYEAVIAA